MDKRLARKLKILDKLYLWHPFTRMLEWMGSAPLIIERGIGNYLIDTKGRRYLDGVSSLWTNLHGHRKPALDKRLKEQIARISHTTLLGLTNVPAIVLAEKLTNIVPKGLTKVFYSDNGSTSVEAALKMAFHYARKIDPRKKTFLSFTEAYHGDTFGCMSVGEIDIFVDRYKPLLFKTHRAPYPYCYRCPIKRSYPDCKIACLDELEKIFEKHHSEIAACIIEPLVECAGGIITAPSGFLKGVKRLTKKYDVLLITDEVATGFGRTGSMFACDKEGVTPDIICLAKGITGGYLPLAATVVKEKIFRAFLGTEKNPDAFYHGHTYTGNPLGCAAAMANIEIFEKEMVLERLKPKIKLLKELLEGFWKLKSVGDVRQCGLIAGVELVENKETKKPYSQNLRVGHKVCTEARKRGLIIRPVRDVIVIMPPLSIKQGELKKLVKIIYDSIEMVTPSAVVIARSETTKQSP